MIRKPKIFISYSRKQFEIANAFEAELRKNGYSVFFDKNNIKVGDSFPEEIKDFLIKCDGVILLISNSSLQSQWCQYEYYYSFLKGKIIIPIITEPLNDETKNPVSYFQKDLNFIKLEDSTPENIKSTLHNIKSKLKSIEITNIKKLLKASIISLFLISSTYIFIRFGIKNINRYSYILDKKNLINSIPSNKVYSTKEINFIANKFRNDKDLAGQLLTMSHDADLSDYTKLNINLLIGKILITYSATHRQGIKNINWRNSIADNTELSNKTFLNGIITNTNFNNTNLSNIYLNNTTLINTNFNQCLFSNVYLYPKEASNLYFTGCKFYSCTIELTNFLNANFISVTPKDPSDVDISMSTYFEKCTFESKFEITKSNTLDFTMIKAAKFKNINFEKCIFNGNFDKDWFTDCGFYNCSFTNKSTITELQIKNTIYNTD